MEKKRCIFCMEELKTEQEPCPFCKRGSWEYRWQSGWHRPYTVLDERYLLGAVAGEGAFGVTYAAWDMREGRRVAVKEYRGASQESLVEEVQLLQDSGEIPGLVKLYGCFEQQERTYLVMEYLPGGSLREYLAGKKEKRLEAGEALRRMAPVAEALAFMHSAGIVHCDISPDNILLDGEGNSRLIDLGAVHRIGQEKEAAALKEAYAAPEQYTEQEHIGPWSDVYGFCALLYQLLTGEKVLPATGRIRRDTLEPLSSYVKIAPQLERAVQQGLELEIQKRFFSMGLLMEKLGLGTERVKPLEGATRHYWGQLWISVCAEAGYVESGRNSRKKRLRRWKRAILAGGVLLLAGAGIFGAVQYDYTIHPEKLFQKKLDQARKYVEDNPDVRILTDQWEGYEDAVRYLEEHGEADDAYPSEYGTVYQLEEKEYAQWGCSENTCRKLYLDKNTLLELTLYYLGMEEKDIYSETSRVAYSWIRVGKSEPCTLEVSYRKSLNYAWNYKGSSQTERLNITFDPADGRAYSVRLSTPDQERAVLYLTEVLPFLCPETYLTEEEAKELLNAPEEGESQRFCLNEKAWADIFLNNANEDILYYSVAIAASGEGIS